MKTIKFISYMRGNELYVRLYGNYKDLSFEEANALCMMFNKQDLKDNYAKYNLNLTEKIDIVSDNENHLIQLSSNRDTITTLCSQEDFCALAVPVKEYDETTDLSEHILLVNILYGNKLIQPYVPITDMKDIMLPIK